MDFRDRASGSQDSDELVGSGTRAPARRPGDPPVVARLMVEIRSDGSYTVARGALEDTVSGQKVAIEATGSSPLALAMSLAKNLADVPFLARQAFRALLRR